MFYLCNAFSINMFPTRQVRELVFTPLSLELAKDMVAKAMPVMAIGHPDTAYNAAVLLGVPEHADNWQKLGAMRHNVSIGVMDTILVVQYRGPRLPEVATELPEGATLELWLVNEKF